MQKTSSPKYPSLEKNYSAALPGLVHDCIDKQIGGKWPVTEHRETGRRRDRQIDKDIYDLINSPSGMAS